jgi:Ca2+-binding EF-hand superfamily protein
MLLRRFDKNNDGQLDATELTEARKVLSNGLDTRVVTPAEAAAVAYGPLFGLRPLIMKRFDHRNDGQLDTAELAEVNAVLFGSTGTPTNSVDDLAALQKEILRHFDKKGDGQLDSTERAAAKAWLEQVIADLDKPASAASTSSMK